MSISKSKATVSNLWPRNLSAVDIDVAYYRNLPHVDRPDWMKEYVRMFPTGGTISIKKLNPNGILELRSEIFETEEEATHFAKAFEKHNYAVIKSVGFFVVGYAHVYSVFSNYRENLGCFIFPNWA